MDMDERCILCNAKNLEILETTDVEVFVTGDRKDYKKRNKEIKKVICKDCGMVHFLQNRDYNIAIDEVFKNYDAMYKKTWFTEGGGYKPQLQAEYERISKAVCLPVQGKMLDIGCGNGEALLQFNKIWPKWDLYGMDIGEQFSQSVLMKKGVKRFFTSLSEIRNCNLKYDFISLNHVLGVANNPAEILETVYAMLADNGIFVILEPDFKVHPWTLYTIDMASVYTKDQLEDIIRGFGFEILEVDFEHEEKEINIFCSKGKICKRTLSNFYEINRKIYNQKIDFLNLVIKIVRKHVKKYTHIGIFGTSIAGVWIAEIIEKENITCMGKKIFYVEEDEEMLQRQTGINGYPIYQLESINEDAVIFLPFPKYTTENIMRRVQERYQHLEFINFYEDIL